MFTSTHTHNITVNPMKMRDHRTNKSNYVIFYESKHYLRLFFDGKSNQKHFSFEDNVKLFISIERVNKQFR